MQSGGGRGGFQTRPYVHRGPLCNPGAVRAGFKPARTYIGGRNAH